MKFLITVSLVFISIQVLPQSLSRTQLDSLYNLFTYVYGVNTSEEILQRIESNPEIIKCGLGVVNSVKQNLIHFTPEQQNILSKLLARPIAQKSAVSPNGFFRVHYDTTGYNAIGYDLNLFMQALDSVYNFEILYLAYPTPPSDGIEGGDDKYDIYIQSIGDYGLTFSETKQTQSRWTSYILIDNDFGSEFYTHGIDAAKVTLAHEFHHAIQFGNYAPIDDINPFRESDRYFYELTSTAFEEFVFDDVNDYYDYMPAYFINPENSLVEYSGYDLAIWNIYLQKNYGFEILKNQWDRIPTMSAIKAVALSINNFHSSLKFELNNFGIWCYYTDTRAISGKYFEEASEYPSITTTATPPFSLQPYNLNLYPVSNYFLEITLPNSNGKFYSIISNSDWANAEQHSTQMFSCTYSIFDDPFEGDKKISNDYSVTLNNSDTTVWNYAGILNDVLIFGGSGNSTLGFVGDTRSFPNPFKLTSVDDLTIEFKGKLESNTQVDINIFSSGLELYYAGKETISIADLGINQITIKNSLIDFPSGVYIYAIRSGKEIWKGKLVIFND